MERAVLFIAHGTVETVDELPAFLATIRRGHAAPPELLAEVRRRYEAIGGRSPLNAINRQIADKLAATLGVPTRICNRLAPPSPRDVLRKLVSELGGDSGARAHMAVIPLAQHSAQVYEASVREAAADVAPALTLSCATDWGQTPALIHAYAARIRQALDLLAPADRAKTTVIMSAHSLPVSVIRAGDAYEREVRKSADAIAHVLGAGAVRCVVAFQSQGMGTGPGGRPVEWLGPDLRATLNEIQARGDTHVVVAPVGFLADHVEILYDIDIEAKRWAAELGLTLSRTESLNAADDLIAVLASIARPLLAGS